MSVIRLPQLAREMEAHDGESILDAARREKVPIATSCGGLGICRKCRVTVREGSERLAPMTMIERDQARLAGFAADERLACQAVVRGDCAIGTSYW